jgi:hypothetical protein
LLEVVVALDAVVETLAVGGVGGVLAEVDWKDTELRMMLENA